jgi:hypothetical protein
MAKRTVTFGAQRGVYKTVGLKNSYPTSRQRGRPKKDKRVTLKKKNSGQKSQIGLDTKTY